MSTVTGLEDVRKADPGCPLPEAVDTPWALGFGCSDLGTAGLKANWAVGSVGRGRT